MKGPAKGGIRIGVSACLLGRRVRYDGGHKKDAFVTGPLARAAALVPVCPEVELGMGTPREPVRLVRIGRGVRMIGQRSRIDHTDAMRRWAEARASALEAEDLCGFVLAPGPQADQRRRYSRVRSLRSVFSELM